MFYFYIKTILLILFFVFRYKNHPLYVLPRHLLKYETIYPQDSLPLGYIKGEPIFSRYCVQVLCSPEKWLREGKSVKLGETSYKIVKSRSKTGKVCLLF